jgi:hypothetical protein
MRLGMRGDCAYGIFENDFFASGVFCFHEAAISICPLNK